MDHEPATTPREPELEPTRADALTTVPPARLARGSAAALPPPEPPVRAEHPELDPDGVPPDVVGLLVFMCWLLGGTIVVALALGSWFLAVGAGAAFVAVLVRLARRARRERLEKYRDKDDLIE